ncbi:Pancreatic triacylglycerol lipase [Halotydeus destructor]|nr:Pancreatic triacylglycerol lipase [Halotydeus destructor]
METADNSKWVSDAVNAYLASGYQVVAVDWRYGSSLQYFQAASNVRVLGMVTGFSLGGQAVGETARYVKRKGFKLPHCIGLDPAGPAFDGGFPNIRLSRSDCDLVQVIHTSAADLPVPINVLLT